MPARRRAVRTLVTATLAPAGGGPPPPTPESLRFRKGLEFCFGRGNGGALGLPEVSRPLSPICDLGGRGGAGPPRARGFGRRSLVRATRLRKDLLRAGCHIRLLCPVMTPPAPPQGQTVKGSRQVLGVWGSRTLLIAQPPPPPRPYGTDSFSRPLWREQRLNALGCK